MLPLKGYFDRLRAQLCTDEVLQKALLNYMGDIGEWSEDKVEAFCQRFEESSRKQAALPEGLDREYEGLFKKASHLQMRLAFLSETGPDWGAKRFGEAALPEMIDSDGKKDSDKMTEHVRRLAARVLLSVCRTPDWVLQGKTGNPFLADLWTGSMCAQCTVVFELVKNVLTEGERREIVCGICRNGIKAVVDDWLDPMQHAHALDTMGHNWWLVIICGAGIACLGLSEEEERCAGWFETIRAGIHAFFRYPGNTLQNKHATFGPGKTREYIEYLGYMTYGFSTYAELESFYRDITGKDDLFEEEYLRPQLQAYLDFMYYSDGGMHLANFGDTPERIVKHQLVIDYLTWRFQCPELFRVQMRMSAGPNEWEDFLYYPLAVEISGEKTTDKTVISSGSRMAVYPHSGYAMIRSSYADEDRFFAIRCGEAWNHNHLDAGSFILSDNGHAVVVDSGYCAYERPEYRDYYSTPQAHSTVLVNGKGEDADGILSGTKFSGNFPHFLDAGEDFRYLLSDCCGPYSGTLTRFYRHVIWLRDLILFVDDLQTCEWNKGAELAFRIQYAEEAEYMAEDAAQKEVYLKNKGCVSRFIPLYPQESELVFGEGYRDGELLTDLGLRDPNRKEMESMPLPTGKWLDVRSHANGRRAKLIHAILRPNRNTEVFCEEMEHYIHVTVKNTDQTEEIWINIGADGSVMHRNSWLGTDSLYTDGFLVYLKKASDDQAEALAVVNGSRLEVKDSFSFGTMLKMDLYVDLKSKDYICASSMELPATVVFGENSQTIKLRNGTQKGTFQQ